jgi:hypothetical protein
MMQPQMGLSGGGQKVREANARICSIRAGMVDYELAFSCLGTAFMYLSRLSPEEVNNEGL